MCKAVANIFFFIWSICTKEPNKQHPPQRSPPPTQTRPHFFHCSININYFRACYYCVTLCDGNGNELETSVEAEKWLSCYPGWREQEKNFSPVSQWSSALFKPSFPWWNLGAWICVISVWKVLRFSLKMELKLWFVNTIEMLGVGSVMFIIASHPYKSGRSIFQ